jgi:CHAT domain-containing protein
LLQAVAAPDGARRVCAAIPSGPARDLVVSWLRRPVRRLSRDYFLRALDVREFEMARRWLEDGLDTHGLIGSQRTEAKSESLGSITRVGQKLAFSRWQASGWGLQHNRVNLDMTLCNAFSEASVPRDARDAMARAASDVDGLDRAGEFRAATRRSRDRLELLREWEGDFHPETIRCLIGLADRVSKEGGSDEAMRLSEEALAYAGALQLSTLQGEAAASYVRTRRKAASSLVASPIPRGDPSGMSRLSYQQEQDFLVLLGYAHLRIGEVVHHPAEKRLGDAETGKVKLRDMAYSKNVPFWLTHDNAFEDRMAAGLASADLALIQIERGRIYRNRAPALARQYLEDAVNLAAPHRPEFLHVRAEALLELGDHLRAEGDAAGARKRIEEALNLYARSLGERHPEYARSLNQLARVMIEAGEGARARPLIERAEAVNESALGRRNPDRVLILVNLAFARQAVGDAPGARIALEQAVSLTRDLRPDSATEEARGLGLLATLLWWQGDRDAATDLLAQCLKIQAAEFSSQLAERDRIATLAASGTFLSDRLSLSAGRHDQDAKDYQYFLSWKGLGGGRTIRKRVDTVVDLERSARYHSNRIAHLIFLPGAGGEQQQENLSGALERLLPSLRGDDYATEDIAEDSGIENAIPEGGALIEYRSYLRTRPPEPGSSRWSREPHYLAFIVRRDRPIVRVELGPAGPIHQAVEAWRGEVMKKVGDPDIPGRQLCKLVWEPLGNGLEQVHTVLIAPDGMLNRVSWGALPGRKAGSYLLEDFAIGLVSSGWQLLALKQAGSVGKGILAAGGVDYGSPEKAASLPGTPPGIPKFVGLGTPLPATRSEAETVAKLFKASVGEDTSILTDDKAEKLTLARTMQGRRYLHLATHGYFRSDRGLVQSDGKISAVRNLEFEIAFPDTLCGLLCAKVNYPEFIRHYEANFNANAIDMSRGLMTALEVTVLNLTGCELVTLSACDTGLGQVAEGEGVLGLVRAFHQAGARAVVASLWSVDDAATRALMIRFYENVWVKKLSKLEALRQAQLALLRGELRISPLPDDRGFTPGKTRLRADGGSSPLRVPPRFWAAFQLSGDYR